MWAFVVPEIGRVTHFSKPGEQNALWTRDASGDEGWKNWGGDKAWWWPQSQWPEVTGTGADWPPPAAIDGTPWELVAASRQETTIRSAIDKGLGAYLERAFALVDAEAAMVVETSLVPVEGAARYRGLTQPATLPAWAVPWTVTQVATDGPIYARLVDGVDADDDGWVQTMMGDDTFVVGVAGRWVEIARLSGDGMMKIGLDADALAVELADGSWLVQRYVGSVSGGDFEAAERAQVFQTDKYVELEFIGPTDGGPGSRAFTLEWRLEDRAPWLAD
ncbi:MAG: hypothetical protein AAF078_11960 [Planctomycetota bacterium]